MASLDGTLNVTGTSLEFVSLVVGALASPYAKPVREWMRDYLPKRLLLFKTAMGMVGFFALLATAILTFVGIVSGGVPIGMPDAVAVAFLVVLPSGAVAGFVGVWLSRATDRGLRRVLQVMVPIFGVGILLQLVAAATP